MKLLIIGAGNMGLTYAKGISKSNFIKEEDIMLMENSLERIKQLTTETKFDCYTNLENCLPKAQIILIAVKPQQCLELLNAIKQYVTDNQVFISIMAGIKLSKIQESIGSDKIVRAMPNLPALVEKGVTGYFASPSLTSENLTTVQQILSSTGIAFKVNKEDLIDATTAISGSGPGYVFYFMEAMINAAMNLGFTYEESKKMTIKTLEGSVELFSSSSFTAQEWIDKVSSKGGTTEAALNYMEQTNVKENLTKGVLTAFDRAQEIGKNS